MKINKPVKNTTHEGAKASIINPLEQLKRSVMACLLWEDSFYENGEQIGERIKGLVHACDPDDVTEIAVKARNEMKLRHVPLLLVRELARHPKKPAIAGTLCETIQRADELAEFLAMYWQDGRQPLSKQVKKGLACAFRKFNEYHLSKYNRDGIVKLRDVLFMVHAKPKDDDQAALWKRLVNNELAIADTWETALSSGQDKKETFERLLKENKLGDLALLRNLRNMKQAEVNEELVFSALLKSAEKSKALPFRYVAAARAVPSWERQIDEAMQIACRGMDKLPGKTVILVDVSGSMNDRLSSKSDLKRIDAACALAVLVRAICDDVVIYSFSNKLAEVPQRSGMALIDAICVSQPHSGTYLGKSWSVAKDIVKYADRTIIITDEQSMDVVESPLGNGYMINVASYQNGIGYHNWTHIHGFSEQIVRYIQEFESGTYIQKSSFLYI